MEPSHVAHAESCAGASGGSRCGPGTGAMAYAGVRPQGPVREFRPGWPKPCLMKITEHSPKSSSVPAMWYSAATEAQALPSWTAYVYIIHEYKVLITLPCHRAAKCAYR